MPLTPADTLLVELLAEVDSLFVPARRNEGDRRRVAHQRAALYASQGLEWASGQADETARKQAQRTLAELDTAGLVVVTRSKGRATWVRFTDAGEDRARALCDLPRIDSAYLTVDELAEFTRIDARFAEQAFCPETRLARCEWDGTADHEHSFLTAESMALPGIIRGWIGVQAPSGRAYYWLTAAGWEIAKSKRTAPKLARIKPDPVAWSVYAKRMRAAIASLSTAEPLNQMEIGPLPIIEHHHGLPIAECRPPGWPERR